MLSEFAEGYVSRPGGAVVSRILARRFGGLLTLSLTLLSGEVLGQSSQPTPQTLAQPARQRDLSQVPLEDLMNIEVTSVSKKEQKMSQAAAAIFVITQEDIRRSGATRIPDLLRMVPGMDVSQINANSWAVSARGFNDQFSNKLLVLIDGRAVYTPLLGGVNWDTQDVPLEDIDRIEVIRGPGATIWGANAVNGVINIVTKSAADTHGALSRPTEARGDRRKTRCSMAGPSRKIRTTVFSRIISTTVPCPQWAAVPGKTIGIFCTAVSGRIARFPRAIRSQFKEISIPGRKARPSSIFSLWPRPLSGNLNVDTQLSGGNILGRWNHTFSSRSDTTFQFYFDNYERTGPESAETRNTIDFDFNHHWAWGSRQDVIWGAGYRRTWDQDLGTIDQAFNPPNAALQLFTFFGQDTVTLQPDRVFLTAGTKVENSYFTGFEIEPSARLAWTPSNWMTLWSAVSRAERSPTQRDTGLDAALAVFPDPAGSNTPVEVILFGNPKFSPNMLWPMRRGSERSPTGGFLLMCRRFSIGTTIWKLWSRARKSWRQAPLQLDSSCLSLSGT